MQQDLSSSQLVSITRSDRWQVHQRLTELGIPSSCLSDGSFQVDLHSPLALIQLRSVLFQLTGARQQLVDWLEQCWNERFE